MTSGLWRRMLDWLRNTSEQESLRRALEQIDKDCAEVVKLARKANGRADDHD